MENIRSYEDMENFVRKVIDNSWDFLVIDNSWDFLFSCKVNMYMFVSIEGTHERYVSYARWLAGDKAKEETERKSILEAESLFEITEEEARSMRYSDEWEERDLAERFFMRVLENKDDFWEAEYMAALDDPETEDNIKKLAADLWNQWKENELDE